MTKKISQLPNQSPPTTSDKVPVVSGGVTSYETISDLITLFFNNEPAGAHNDVTRLADTMYDFVAQNTGVWTGDNLGVNKNASMTALTVYINGRRITIGAVSARVFTASKDTYIDVLDNADGTGTLVYTEVSNNAASPALAANSLRLGIIVTGATTIAAAGSINQGQEDKVLPIASSIAYSVTDSLGNLICSRDPNHKLLGYRQITSNFTTTSSAQVQITGLSCPVIVPLGRKIKATLSGDVKDGTAGNGWDWAIWDGVVVSGTQIQDAAIDAPGVNYRATSLAIGVRTPAAASKTYNGATSSGNGTATTTVNASATAPAFIKIELE